MKARRFTLNIDDVVIQTNEKLGKSKTDGTTGKSLQVYAVL